MHVVSVYQIFYEYLSYNIKMYYFTDNHELLREIFKIRLFPSIFEIIIRF